MCSTATSAERSRGEGTRAGPERRALALAFASVLLASCAGSATTSAGRATDRCDVTVATGTTIQPAVDAAEPGDTVCVSAGAYAERVHVSSGGAEDERLVLMARGVVAMEGFVVTADYVTIVGFSVTNPLRADDTGRNIGISLAGRGLVVEGNRVWFPAADGIGCEQNAPFCPDAVIKGNVVHGAEGTGIISYGDAVLIEGNDVSGSTAHRSVDADGIRFFGADVTVRANWVHDIRSSGYPQGQAPHTDCFQTFAKSGFVPRRNVVADNVCARVDDQCLVADGEESVAAAASGGTDAGEPSLELRGNTCQNVGSQAVLSRRLPHLRIIGNHFDRTILHWGVNLQEGSHSAQVTGNTFVGSYEPVLADESSQPGLVMADNVVRP